MSDLVKRLSKGSHPVAAVRYKSAEEFQEAVDRGFVLVKFTETKGGTELGFKIDAEPSQTDPGTNGKVKLAGRLTLDYVPVVCQVELDVKTLKGKGSLIPADAENEPEKTSAAKASKSGNGKAGATRKRSSKRSGKARSKGKA